MELNMEKVPLKNMTHKQFREWLLPIVEHTLFVYRERILELLTVDMDRGTLTEAFREFFEAYYYDVAFELDRHEKCLLSVLDSCDTYVSLKHRVATVESKRRASPMGREVRRTGSYLPGDPVPRIKISALSNDAFREFLHTLVRSEFFAAHDQVVKLLSVGWPDTEDMPLREAVYEFFVGHLELEQFLEDYAYDPDEGLEIRPEVAEELEQSITDHESGAINRDDDFIPLTEDDYDSLVVLLGELTDVVRDDENHFFAPLMEFIIVLIEKYDHAHNPELAARIRNDRAKHASNTENDLVAG